MVHLLKAGPKDVVCLEVFDDVGVECHDGGRIAEQSKSIQSANPLTDRAIEFWKTIRNWVDAVADGSLDVARSVFVIYAPTAAPGNIATSFADAKTLDDARKVIDAAKAAVCESARDGTQDTTEVAKHIKIVFDAADSVLPELVTRFHIESGAARSDDDVRPLMLDKLVSEDNYDNVVGWVKRQVDAMLETNTPVRIPRSSFHETLLTYVRSHDRINILRSFACTPSPDQIESEMAVRIYVRQLELIDMDPVDVIAAVNDFLRAEIDRTEWADRGFVTERSLSDFADELETAWRNNRRRISIMAAGCAEPEQGQLLHADCMEHRGEIDGLNTPVQFVRGSLHALADDRTIGWHPRYGDLLDEPPSAANE